ncbi:PREDICTED: cation/calcium exchanger 5 [Nicotiana attenuata]|uniref:Cationcalcium exchanger 5 n=1 Tax=Nicotiana attenuata TaxID=49451 RepID=A0A314KQ52_NICAT|nr:PREDICTED: cation/calcium exchanger 5 [Nicotiana attenuata]OIT30929.1 cationcalcium exchanger 5 [Nicotiana attenuata]
MAFNFSYFNTTLTSLFLLTTLLFFFIVQYSPNHIPKSPHRSLLIVQKSNLFPCNFTDSNGIFNYFSFHYCLFQENPFFSIPFFTLCVFLQFYILIKTAQDYFSVVVTKLSTHLRLSPSMGAVTLLALGNGAPDVFASVAAVRGGQARTGFGAILSAGTFVSAFVVGFVAIYAAPFPVDPAPFVRDVMFYLTAALFLFYVYLSAEIFLWQAIGFVGFYLFFVGFVFYMDFGMGCGKGKGAKSGGEVGLVRNDEVHIGIIELDSEKGKGLGTVEDGNKQTTGSWQVIEKVTVIWKLPVSMLLKLTIPQTAPSEWSRFYLSANIALCPLLLLFSCKSFVPLNHPISFLLSDTHFPLWFIVFCASCSLAIVHFIVEKEAPKTEQMPAVVIAFVMSVFWISTVAGELLNCLAVLGVLLKLPSAFLGLTVLAWGNSVGDLVADVAVAKAGQPAMAMAGCFAGPMFNMLFGLGTALVIQTADVYPKAYELHFHVSIVVAFVFLLFSLMGSLLVVTWNRFRVPRFWGFCLVGLYIVFMLISLVIAKFSA